MFGRENAIGVVLLLLCAIVAGALIYSIGAGTRFHWTGPPWVGPVLAFLFLAAGIYSLANQFRGRFPWDRNRDQDQQDR